MSPPADRPVSALDPPPDRGSAGICIPVYGALDEFAQCLRSVLSTVPAETHVLVADDASAEPGIGALIAEANAAHPDRVAVIHARRPENLGFVKNVNWALQELAPADAIILNSDCVVHDGWYEGLRRAAYSDSRVATATAMSNNATIVSVPERNRPLPALPQDWSLAEASHAIRVNSLRLLPEIPTAIGHCMYLRRSALDLVGYLDEAFSPGYEEEVDFSQRCIRHGLCHVLADDVLVLHHGGASFRGEGASATRDAHHKLVLDRYPYWDNWVQDVAHESDSALARALAASRRAMGGMSVAIDGRLLTQFVTGSQVHILEVVASLHDLGEFELRVIVPSDLGDYAARVLGSLENVRIFSEHELPPEPADVVHRPFQLRAKEDMELLLAAGRRIVITQQDLIAYHNPAYHDTYDQWQEQRAITRQSLQTVDRVAFFSRHARREAVREELVESWRATAIALGTDHRLTDVRPSPVMPRGAQRLAGAPFLMCLGTDFLHKNRLFAIRVLEALRERHGWEGRLALVGPHVSAGSSAGEEARELATEPSLAEHVVSLAAVDEAGKRWLFERSAAAIYPTVYEGFGLLPFEAAEAGIPCLFAPQTSLPEVLPVDAALLVPWDAPASAERVIGVLRDEAIRKEHVATLRAAAAPLTWSRTARELVSLYRDAIEGPSHPARSLVAELAEENEEDELTRALVGPGGAITEDLQRPLLAVLNRRPLRAVVTPPLRGMYRLSRLAINWREGSRSSGDSS